MRRLLRAFSSPARRCSGWRSARAGAGAGTGRRRRNPSIRKKSTASRARRMCAALSAPIEEAWRACNAQSQLAHALLAWKLDVLCHIPPSWPPPGGLPPPSRSCCTVGRTAGAWRSSRIQELNTHAAHTLRGSLAQSLFRSRPHTRHTRRSTSFATLLPPPCAFSLAILLTFS